MERGHEQRLVTQNFDEELRAKKRQLLQHEVGKLEMERDMLQNSRTQFQMTQAPGVSWMRPDDN